MATGRGYHLAPSPNWYCPHISDCNTSGLLAYGARHEVVLLRTNIDPPIFELIQNVHSDRVTAVCFSKLSGSTIATGSDDCFVRIWNLTVTDNGGHLLNQDKELKFEQKIACVAWQPENQTVFVSEGSMNVWVWDVRQDSAKLLKHRIRFQPLVLAPCPYKVDHLAVGFKGGILAILDISKNGNVVMKLKGHEDDIISLSWNPKPSFKVNDSLDLASTSRDRSLRVWNLEKEQYIHLVKVPQVQGHNKNATDINNKNRMWITCLWVPEKENQILCTTVSGEVMQVEFNQSKKPFWTSIDTKQAGGHNRCIFTLSICGNVLCSVSLDRQIVLYDLGLLKSIFTLGTLGGFAQCMSVSPIDVGRLAIGCGDKTIRIWRTSSSASPYITSMLWQGINGKVTTLTWHPKKENQLAFGTAEGHVGTLDSSGTKPPVICKTFHRQTVYTLCWGPFKESLAADKYFLYSCGDGNVLIHDPSQHEKEAKNLNDFLNPKSTSKKSEISWKQDYKALAVGCEDGSIEVYSSELELLALLKAQKNLIQCLRWHPISTSLNPSSLYQHYLASSSYDAVVHVYNLKEAMEGEKAPTKVITQSNIQLVGHTSRVNSLSWNPHIDGQLASGSYDRSVQIWNTVTSEPIGNYRGHRGLVFCVQWSATDPEMVFSGGDDLSVQQFSVSSLQHHLPPPKKNKKSKSSGQKGVLLQDGHDESPLEDTEILVCNGEIKLECEPPKTVTATASQGATGCSKKKKKKPASQKSGFPICNSLDARGKDGTLEDIIAICREIKRSRESEKPKQVILAELPDLKTSPNLGFFLRSSDFRKTQAVEENGHRESGNSELLFQISLWRGDIEGVVREAANLGQLSDYLVSLAPLGSRALWLEMCEKYAVQLEKEENYTKAAQYYLACHKIYEAVEMLINQHCFREALALAKGRFPQTDPVFERIYRAWASKAEKDGNFELVAKCYLALSEPERAAKCLTRRNDAHSHSVAAYISAIHGLAEDTEDCVISCIHQALTRNEWEVARAMLIEQRHLGVVKNLQLLRLVVTVHEFLTSSLKVAQEQSKPLPMQALLNSDPGEISFWKGTLLENSTPFLELLNQKVGEEEPIIVHESLDILQKLSGQRSLSSREIIYETAVGLTQYLLAEDTEVFVSFSKVLGTNYSAEPEYTILNALCKLVFPFELSIPLCFKNDNTKASINLSSPFNELVKQAFCKSGSKSRPCNAESSILAFFAANLLDCLTQEASKLPKSAFLKHEKECEDCEKVLESLTSILNALSSLLKQQDFFKHETLSLKLKKLDENIAKTAAQSRSGGNTSKQLQELQKQRKDVMEELSFLPQETSVLPYPRNSLISAKAKELCKQLALALKCTKSSAKVRTMSEKF